MTTFLEVEVARGSTKEMTLVNVEKINYIRKMNGGNAEIILQCGSGQVSLVTTVRYEEIFKGKVERRA